MSSTTILIVLIAKQYNIYASIIILIVGMISNTLNIAIFTQLTIFRRNQSAFYFTIGSIVDSIQILLIFTIRIPTYTFNPDPTNTSIALCKLRATVAIICIVISLGTVCCASIDQFLSTNYHARLRQMSTLKLAHCLTLIIACLALLHSVLFLAYSEIVPNLGCTLGNLIFRLYTLFIFYSILCGVLPISVASTFAILAYCNVRRITRRQVPVFRRRLDKQLTVMVLVRVCLYVITNVPYIVSEIFWTSMPPNPNDILRVAIYQLVSLVTYSIFFLNYSVTFYVFLISSTRFRRQVKYFLFKKLTRSCRSLISKNNNSTRCNQVAPISYLSVKDVE